MWHPCTLHSVVRTAEASPADMPTWAEKDFLNKDIPPSPPTPMDDKQFVVLGGAVWLFVCFCFVLGDRPNPKW